MATLARIVGGPDKLVEIDRNIRRVWQYHIENPRIIKMAKWPSKKK